MSTLTNNETNEHVPPLHPSLPLDLQTLFTTYSHMYNILSIPRLPTNPHPASPPTTPHRSFFMNMQSENVTIPASGTQTATVIFLHGLGDSGHGWAPVFRAFNR